MACPEPQNSFLKLIQYAVDFLLLFEELFHINGFLGNVDLGGCIVKPWNVCPLFSFRAILICYCQFCPNFKLHNTYDLPSPDLRYIQRMSLNRFYLCWLPICPKKMVWWGRCLFWKDNTAENQGHRKEIVFCNLYLEFSFSVPRVLFWGSRNQARTYIDSILRTHSVTSTCQREQCLVKEERFFKKIWFNHRKTSFDSFHQLHLLFLQQK